MSARGPSRGPDRVVVAACVGVVFLVLAAANSGGYRYGASDQAFYIPAIYRHVDPALFPRDRVLIDEQARLFWLDDLAGWLAARRVPVPAMFATGFVTSGVLLGASLWWLARGFGLGAASALAFVLAMTLRHRVAETGVNTFEGYFHPRVLAFAFGIASVAAAIRNRTVFALGLVLVALFVHPTTGGWFAAWLMAASAVTLFEKRARWSAGVARRVAVGTLVAAAGAAILSWFAVRGVILAERLEPMDAAWRAVLASKDYLFPNEWPAFAWVAHVASAVILTAGLAWRRRSLATFPRETAVALGCLALFFAFLITLPLVAYGIPLFVQMQISRALWPVETMASLYLVWLLGEAPGPGAREVTARSTTRSRVLLLLVAAAALARGTYVASVERPDRRTIQYSLPQSAWTEVLDWARRETPPDAYFLADPGHGWKYAVSIRVGALRDVYLEEAKDTAMALYSRASAQRVLDRIQALDDFAELTPARLDALVARFGLTHLVRERLETRDAPCFGHPVIWSNSRFVVCGLEATPTRTGGASPPRVPLRTAR